MKQPNIRQINTLPEQCARIVWADGSADNVNLSALVREFAALAPLDDAGVFNAAQVGEDGWSLLWPNGAEVGADTLWRLAREQAGDAMPVRLFAEWRARHGLSLTAAGKALGVTRRMVAYYESGRHLVPRTVMLACKGWEVEQREQTGRIAPPQRANA